MNDLPGLSYCPSCHEAMIAADGKPTCLNCDGRKSKPSKRIAVTPTAEEFKKVMGNVQYEAPKPVATVTKESYTAKDALHIMNNLPMPKDEKEFKQIKKIIKQLEKLVGEGE